MSLLSLPHAALKRSVALPDHCWLADDIMMLPDISVDESEQIPRILEPLTAGILEAVLPSSPSGTAAGKGGSLTEAEAAEEAAAALGGESWEILAAALHERTPAVMKLRVRKVTDWGQMEGRRLIQSAVGCTACRQAVPPTPPLPPSPTALLLSRSSARFWTFGWLRSGRAGRTAASRRLASGAAGSSTRCIGYQYSLH